MGIHVQTRSYAWVFALMGIVSILFGLTALAWPGMTLGALVFVYGFYAVVAGVLALIYTFQAGSQKLPWWPSLLMAIVDLGAAAVVFTQPALTAIALVYVIAFWAILAGVFEIFASFATARFLWLLAGVLAIVAGLVLLANPRDGALALVLVIGIFAIVRGIFYLVDAFRGPEIAELRLY